MTDKNINERKHPKSHNQREKNGFKNSYSECYETKQYGTDMSTERKTTDGQTRAQVDATRKDKRKTES